MINRVLIRIKTVQLLYSYLLVENPFKLESQPLVPTKEKRYAYGLYLDLLLLMTRLAAGIQKRGGARPLYDTRFIQRVLADEKIKSLAARYRTMDFPFASVEDSLRETIKDSGIYKKYARVQTRSMAAEDNVWKEIFDLIICKDQGVKDIAARREGYTLRGYERACDMVDETFESFFASADHLPDALRTLKKSLGLSRELYFRLLRLPVDLTDLRSRDIEDARGKYIRTEEDINPNMRMVDNELVRILAENPEINAYLEEHKVDWAQEDPALMRMLLRDVLRSSLYEQYMNFPTTDFMTDCEFWREILKTIIFRSTDFLEALEDKSVFWNDDIDTIGTFVLKSIRRIEEHRDDAILPMYKDEEDAEFGAQLFSAVVRNKELYRTIIDEAIDKSQWETERLAFMDVVVMMTAIAEIMNFPKIPLKVSFNEYIEIAKCYCSPKSGYFLNGVLSSIIEKLKEEGKINKNI